MIIGLRKRERNYTIYLFIELILILTSLMFILSMFMDIFSKLKLNKEVMDLNYYISSAKDTSDLENTNVPYYKNSVFKDSVTGEEFDVILISPKFLELKKFNVIEGSSFTEKITENEVLVGANIKKQLGDKIYINGFTEDIDVTVNGILDSNEVLWTSNEVVPTKLDNSLIILDRETDNYSSPKIFSNTTEENFIKINTHIFRELFKKNSSIYISLIFIIILLIVIINSIDLIISLLINKQRNVFGIKYSLGCTKNQLFYSILFEFYLLSILAIGVSTIISLCIQLFIPIELGYTFNIYSFIISIVIYVLLTLRILYKQNKKIDEYMIITLLKRRL
ncbi:ABC transporter permease [Clostridium sp.]|uniref:ABC transporter permease n=1 Tax=Clostridium sp. TaxID=1506 RepID=UPI002FC971EB